VLSGFLITNVLLETRDTTNFFRIFYARRALRIFPVYYSAVALVFGAHLLFPHYPAYKLSTQLWYWVNASNLPTAMYAAGVADLTHFWTLAIEEQFYLLWPLLVLKLRNRTLLSLCMIALPVEYALRVLPAVGRMNAITDNQFSYRLTPLHSEGLFAGAAVAILVSQGRIVPNLLVHIRRMAGVLGVVAFLLIRWNSAPEWIVASRFTFLALAYASLVAVLVAEPIVGRVADVLSSRALRSVGRLSFSIYVIHLPIMNYMKSHRFRGVATKAALLEYFVICLTLTVACAYLTWWAVEEPALALKRHFLYTRRPVVQS
jgi:peptidoglycan/LPS O-acetylase OafA/YrhL